MLKDIAIIDLFCGVGGLTCGLKQAGLNVIAGIDFDKSCKYGYVFNLFIKSLYEPINCISILSLSAPTLISPFEETTKFVKGI